MDYHFWRYDLRIPMQGPGMSVRYDFGSRWGGWREFRVAGIGDNWRIVFESCSGYSLGVDEKAVPFGRLWDDVLSKHSEAPFHLLVGGGDQIYLDDMFHKVPCLIEWLKINNRHARAQYPFSPNHQEQVSNFVFLAYLSHFSRQPMAHAFATIPTLNIVDDHDIFDGFGSYDTLLQQSPTFQGIGVVAKHFFLLFQHHATEQVARQVDGMFGERALHCVRRLSPHLGLVGLDGRFERSKEQVISPTSLALVQHQMYSLAHNTPLRHILVITGIPFLYPRLERTESILRTVKQVVHSNTISAFTQFLQQRSTLNHVVNQFGDPELLDDLSDHWTSQEHTAERTYVIHMLQRFAYDTGVRVTLVGGDVHCAAAGYFFSNIGNGMPYHTQDQRRDFRFMVQLVSSGMVNAPPPLIATELVHLNSEKARTLDQHTWELMWRLFDKDVDGSIRQKANIMDRRNWCSIEEMPDGDLLVHFFVEHTNPQRLTATYPLRIPPLEQQFSDSSPLMPTIHK
jgi:hypothetical protein